MKLVLTLSFSGSYAMATEPVNATSHLISENLVEVSSFTISQYDAYVSMKQKNSLLAFAEEYSLFDVENTQSNLVEIEMFTRAQLSASELEAYGYTPSQIATLQAYDGTPLEENPQMKSVMANFSGTMYENGFTSTNASMVCRFMWDSVPAVCAPGFEDYVNCNWAGFSEPNGISSMRYIGGTCYVDYYQGTSYSYQTTTPIAVIARQGAVQARVPQNDWSGKWAKTIWLYVDLQQENPNMPTIHTTTFHFSYGHVIMIPNGGATILPKPSLGVSYGLGISDMYRGDHTIEHF